MNDLFSFFGIDSGNGLKKLLDDSGLVTEGVALETSENVIRLPEYITLNWKSRNRQIRVNCKENEMLKIEQYTDLKHFLNGKGDPTHPYSFLVDSFPDLIDMIYVLRRITM